MRLATVASIAVLAVSSAALVQVASSPVEEKTATGNVAASAKTEGMDNGVLANGAGNTSTESSAAPAPAPTGAPRRR